MSRGFAVDEEAIRKLARLLDETGLTEIEVAEKESRIRVVRRPAPVVAAAPVASAPAVALSSAVVAAAAPAAPVDATHPGAVTSPMVGIAYLAPEPGAVPFVKPGDRVTAGQTLVLIEAMKTFNPIKAPRAGTVSQILIESGAPVEYGEVLLVLE